MDELQERRGPGRPPKYTEVQATTTEPARPPRKRKPFGAMEQSMAYELRPGFHRHWFNDIVDSQGPRIQRAKEAGYEHVSDREGKNVSMVVGTMANGAPMTAFLMEIPQEWYEEDIAAQQKIVDEREAAIKRGESDRQQGDGRYIPSQGISIKHG